MKDFKNCAAQGDMLIRRIEKLPDSLRLEPAVNGEFIITHSETGHNHVVKEREDVFFYSNDNDPLIAYMQVIAADCLLEHKRSNDTHETIKISPGVYEIRRQREYSPEGWRRAVD